MNPIHPDEGLKLEMSTLWLIIIFLTKKIMWGGKWYESMVQPRCFFMLTKTVMEGEHFNPCNPDIAKSKIDNLNFANLKTEKISITTGFQ